MDAVSNTLDLKKALESLDLSGFVSYSEGNVSANSLQCRASGVARRVGRKMKRKFITERIGPEIRVWRFS